MPTFPHPPGAVTDPSLRGFAAKRLRPSLPFLSPYPPLQRRCQRALLTTLQLSDPGARL